MLEVTTVTINKNGQLKERKTKICTGHIALIEPTQAGPYRGTTYILLSTGHHRFVKEDLINEDI